MIVSKNSKYMESQEDTEEWLLKITNDLKIKSNDFFNQILGSLELIGDTLIAMEDFTSRGCSSYLDIYGVLNAVYLQKEAILMINRNFQLGNDKKINTDINNLEILDIRHKLASHSVNYRNSDNKIEVYSITRCSIDYNGFTYYKFSFKDNEGHIYVDLFEKISEYLNYVIELFEIIIPKLIEKIFNDGKKEEIYFSDTQRTEKQVIKTRFLNDFKLIKENY